MNNASPTRRRALQTLLAMPAVSSVEAQTRVAATPLGDLANVFDLLSVARQKLVEDVYLSIAGTDRRTFDRMTFRPRMMVNVAHLDLTCELLGTELFAPILIGPMSYQQTFHPEGELAMVLGANAARALVIVSSRSSRKLSEIVAAAKTPLWFQIYPEPDVEATIATAQNAVELGCKAVCVTVGAPMEKLAKLDWEIVARIRKSIKAPLVLKGVMDPEEAQAATAHGVEAIVVSNHGGNSANSFADPMAMLPSVADAVGNKIPVLVDGSFRRGTDILKALALGARAVLLGRPPVWGLAAYGAEGVQRVMEIVQTELARNMALCGKPDLKSIDRGLVRIHKR